MKDKTILLVEDNPDDEELTLRAFKKANISNRVRVVRDGAEALDYFFGASHEAGQEARALPTLVLLDLNLPKVDGLEVLTRLRADDRTKRLPIVMLTTSHEQEEVVRAYDRGCNAYVRKPVDSPRFQTVVTQLGLFWLIDNVPPPESS
jgi:two-component system, response regulator